MNAKKEFLGLINHVSAKLRCAIISKGNPSYKNATTYSLTVGYDRNEFDLFLEAIDFHYDDGYGRQEIYGNIWFDDGSWAKRCEYDGSEWWEYKECSEIPKLLNK